MRIEPGRALAVLALCAMTVAAGLWAVTVMADPPCPGWPEFKQRFIGADGRVVDTGSGGVSHSEGQGWSMLFAEASDDRATFDKVWYWTLNHLRRPDSALFAWRFDPDASEAVQDPNNSTDADLTIAWALSRAARRWHDDGYEKSSHDIRQEIVAKLLRTSGKRQVLLPGLQGFEREEGVIFNPSYLVVPALEDFARQQPDGPWADLLADGLELLLDARFGRYGLAPDWLLLSTDGRLAPAPGWPPRFGFDAARVPLYLAWGGYANTRQTAQYVQFWKCPPSACKHDVPPAWVDLATGQGADFPASRGVLAVRSLTLGNLDAIPQQPRADDDYYSAALILLSQLAASERGAAPPPSHVPAAQPKTKKGAAS